MPQFNWERNLAFFETHRCSSSHPGSQALKHIIQNCVTSFRCKILPQNKNKDLLPGNLTGFHGAEFGTYACLLAVTISWLPNLYWNLRKAVPSAPEVPDAMEIWLVKISMKASVTGWCVLASLTWTFSVTSVMTNNHSNYRPKSFCRRQQLEHASTLMTKKTRGSLLTSDTLMSNMTSCPGLQLSISGSHSLETLQILPQARPGPELLPYC